MEEDDKNDETVSDSKKMRTFSAKEFRHKLTTVEILNALQEFVLFVVDDRKQDVILEYLEGGGSCIELLQTLEKESIIPVTLVLDIYNRILLRVLSDIPQYHSQASESCRYFLNSYMTLINKMINPSSTTKERKIILKLLTAIVSFSSIFAKDILVHVNFNWTNLAIITKQTGEKGSVRNAFIHFLIAYLLDDHYPTILVLLGKKGLLTSVVSSLQYDLSDTVCIFMTALKNQVLENPNVSKTVKMQTFSTPVVKDIVNLYNWKGLDGFNLKNKKKGSSFQVDDLQKVKVSEAVHEFLLVLCTSHKYGVIFKDVSLGLSKKNNNILIHTVLESLERPWEHSYVCDLVTKICGASPGLAKTMWLNLKPFIEPRNTKQWLNAMKFAGILLEELKPSSFEFCARELNIFQTIQIVQVLIAPTPILKTIIAESEAPENQATKHEIFVLLCAFLRSIHQYLNSFQAYLSSDNFRQLKNLISSYVRKNFPKAENVFKDWDKLDENLDSAVASCEISNHLKVILELFELYEILSPQLLDDLKSTTNLQGLLSDIRVATGAKVSALHFKAIKLFLLDSALFLPKSELFDVVVLLILEFYHSTQDSDARDKLNYILRISSIFESSEQEINVWINGVLNSRTFNESLGNFFGKIIKNTYENMFEYIEEMRCIKETVGIREEDNYGNILKKLHDDNSELDTVYAKHINLSPLLLGCLKCLSTEMEAKSIRNYITFVLLNLFHLQTTPAVFVDIISKNEDLVPKNLVAYVLNWQKGEPTALKASKGILSVAHDLSVAIFNNDSEIFIAKNSTIAAYLDQKFDLLQMCIFYMTNLVNIGKFTISHLQTCENLVKHMITVEGFQNLGVIFNNPVLLDNFSPSQIHKSNATSFCTQFLVGMIKQIKNLVGEDDLELYLMPFRSKLVNSIRKILKKAAKSKIPSNSEQFTEIIDIFDLDYAQCSEIIINFAAKVPETCLVSQENKLSVVYGILVHLLRRFTHMCMSNFSLEPLEPQIVSLLMKFLTYLNNCPQNFDTGTFAEALKNYLSNFSCKVEFTEKLFESVLQKPNYCRENSVLAAFLLKENGALLPIYLKHISSITGKKGLMLPLLDVALKHNVGQENLQIVYNNLEPSVVKALHKPQKAGQHFENYYEGVARLISELMPLEKCNAYLEKIQKHDISEIFLANFFDVIFRKALFTNKNLSEKFASNAILTFAHLEINLLKKKTKSEEDWKKIDGIAKIFQVFLESLAKDEAAADFVYRTACENENLQLFCKFCLKFGISGSVALLKALLALVSILKFDNDEAQFLLEMVFSHSECLDLVLSEDSGCKVELLGLMLMLCHRWPSLMQRYHIPVLLASYQATIRPADRKILRLLRKYEDATAYTNFYDFKPFLWGRAAAGHYSVRSDLQNALWRQPKIGDVLDILQENWVLYTIKYYPLDLSLDDLEGSLLPSAYKMNCIYDFSFVLPLFSSLLVPENAVQGYRFTRSGGLALTIAALSSNDRGVRHAACHVLARFYYHLEAQRGGKDKLLWLRFIDVICKGVAVLEDTKLNNFSSVFLAQMSLVLTQPFHVMYVPLSQYLGAKVVLDLSGIPELYTFLHSQDINYKEHRSYILEIIRDGLRTDHDFNVALRSMAFKFIMELFSSSLVDVDAKLIIADIFVRVSNISFGLKLLCSGYGFLSWLYDTVNNIVSNEFVLISYVIKIVFNLINASRDCKGINLSVVSLIIVQVIEHLSDRLSEDDIVTFLRCLELAVDTHGKLFSDIKLSKVITFIEKFDAQLLDKQYYLRMLTLRIIKDKVD